LTITVPDPGRKKNLESGPFRFLIEYSWAKGTHINVKKNSESENFMSGDL